MSDSNPFDDLAENDDESEGRAGEDRGVELESKTKPDDELDADPERPTSVNSNTERDTHDPPDRSDTSREASVEGPTLTNSSPPFPYSDAEQKQMYVRDGLWDDFEDLGFDAELELRRTFEVRNVEQRELDTAIIRLVLDRLTSREIAEKVVQMRGFDPSKLE